MRAGDAIDFMPAAASCGTVPGRAASSAEAGHSFIATAIESTAAQANAATANDAGDRRDALDVVPGACAACSGMIIGWDPASWTAKLPAAALRVSVEGPLDAGTATSSIAGTLGGISTSVVSSGRFAGAGNAAPQAWQ